MRTKLVITHLVMAVLLFTVFPFFYPAQALGEISEGSGVANISLEGLSEEEATLVLQDAVIAWYDGEPLLAENEYETVEIPRQIFIFDIESTLAELDQKTERTWTAFFRKTKDIMIPLKVSISEERVNEVEWPTGMDTYQTLEKLLFNVSNLESGQVVLEYEEGANLEEIELAEVSLSLPDNSIPVIERIITELNDTIITSESVFSFIESAYLPNGIEKVDSELTFVASGVYELALQTNLEVVERHQMKTAPFFTEPGFEAAINFELDDNLLIYNPTAKSYSVHAEIVEDEMKMKITTLGEAEDAAITRKNVTEIEPRTVYRYSSDLSFNEQIVEVEGSPGLQLEVYKNDGQEEIRVSQDYYPPQQRVVLTSTITEAEVVEEETVPTTEEVTDFLSSDLSNGELEERVSLALECDGDLECEESLGVSSMDRMIASCFIGNMFESSDGVTDGTTVSDMTTNGFCDMFFFLFFLGLLSDETMSGEEYEYDIDWDKEEIDFITEDEWEYEENTEETEEVDEVVVK